MGTFLKPRLGVLTALRAQSGTRACFIPRDDVLAFETPDAVDLTGDATLVVRASSGAAAELTAGRVIEVEDFSSVGVVSRTEEWRILTRRVVDGAAAGDGPGTVTCTLAHPITDWPDAGRLVSWSADGLPSWDLSGIYTPAQLLALLCDHLGTQGQGHWTPGTCDRSDPRELRDLVDVDAAEARELAQTTWALEPVPERTDANTWTIHLRAKRGSDAAVPTLRTTGALESVDWTQDAVPLATAVLPKGADGATIAHAGWTVASVDTGTDVVGLIDGDGGAGPILGDGQLVGAYLRRVDGTLTQITATLQNDGVTSLVTVADASGISAGSAGVPPDVVEFRRDGAGAKCVVLTTPAAISAYRYREVPYERPDLTGARNYASNARGRDYQTTTTAPDGWAIDTDHGATIERVTGGYPAGCPAGDLGFCWQWTTTWPGQVMTFPLTPAIDPIPGDEDVSYQVLIWVDLDLHNAPNGSGDTFVQPKPAVRLRDGSGTLLDAQTADVDGGQTFLTLGRAGVRLDALARCQIELTFEDGSVIPSTGSPFAYTVGDIVGGVAVYVFIVQLTRTTATLDWVEGAPVNLLHQAGAAFLASRCAPEDRLALRAADYAITNPAAFSDTPLVTGGDVVAQAPRIGLNRRVRLLSARRDRLTGASPTLDVVAAPDLVVAALLGAAAPSRKRDLLDLLREVSGRASGSATTTTTTETGVGAPAIVTTYERTDPRYYGASGEPADAGVDVTDAVQMAADWGNALASAPHLRFWIRGLNVQGHNMPGPNNGTPGFTFGPMQLAQVDNADDGEVTPGPRSLLYIETCDSVSMLPGFQLYGNKANQTQANRGIYAVNTNFAKVVGLLVRDFKGTNIYVDQGSGSGWLSDENGWFGVETIFSDEHGLVVTNSGDLNFVGLHANFNAYKGAFFQGCYTSSIVASHLLTNDEEALLIDGSREFYVGGGTMLRENQREGLVLSGGAGGHVVNGLLVKWNSLAGVGSYDGIKIDTCPDVRLTDVTSSEFYYTSAGYPVSGTSRQRYGVYAIDATNLRILGGSYTPNVTGGFGKNGGGSTTGQSLFADGITDGAL